MSGHVHVLSPEVTAMTVVRGVCLDCGKRTRMLAFHQDWYGWHTTCLRCGRQWDGGEWLPLPFYRYARRDNIQGAKGRWRRISQRIAAQPDKESVGV